MNFRWVDTVEAQRYEPRDSRVRRGLLALGVAAGLLAAAPAAQAYTCGSTLDNFNRANSTNLGPNWTEQAEDWSISGQKATQPLTTAGLMTYNGVSSSEACLDVTKTGAGGQYAGVVLDYASLPDNRFIKVQNNNNTTQFDKAFFYAGNNNPDGAGASPPNVALTPFPAARLHVREVGNVVILDVDIDFDGTPEQTVSSTFLAAGSGTGIGVNGWGGALLDNFAAVLPPPVTPPPASTTPDTTKPVLSALGMSPALFRAAKSGPSASARKKPVGTKVSFNLSEPSAVKLTVERTIQGRKVGKNCKAQTRANRRKKACVRSVKVNGSFTIVGKAGKNSFKFRGRIGGKTLKPGNYRLNGQATDPAKNNSALKRKGFKIVR